MGLKKLEKSEGKSLLIFLRLKKYILTFTWKINALYIS